MSHMEMGRFEYAEACERMLDNAKERIERLLESAKAELAGSKSIMDDEIQKLMNDLEEESERMLDSIAVKRASIGSTAFGSQIDDTRMFLSQVNVFDLKYSALKDALKSAFMERMSNGTANHELEDYMSDIQDPKLRSVMTLLSRNKTHKNLSPEELQEMAECILDPSRKTSRKNISRTISKARAMMSEEKVSDDPLAELDQEDEPVSPLEIMETATDAIIDEKLRRSAINAITKSIASRGFIIDRKNIRHIKETDTVKLTAMKPGGQKVEFNVDLNGKFMYHFQGYEGLACEKDISAMEKDLEEIYGIKIRDKKTTWSNPDKLMKAHNGKTMVKRSGRCRSPTHSTG